MLKIKEKRVLAADKKIDIKHAFMYNNEIVKYLYFQEREQKNTMEAKKKLLTYAGLKALEEELENLKLLSVRKLLQR